MNKNNRYTYTPQAKFGPEDRQYFLSPAVGLKEGDLDSVALHMVGIKEIAEIVLSGRI